jgi:hypothetical protein
MYELTESEGRTILTVLAEAGEKVVRGFGWKGIPSSTFYSIRKKAYESGWLTDRYVPNPWVNGLSSVECILAKPGAADYATLERRWAADPESVVVWTGLNSMFGIFFRKQPDPSPPEQGTRVAVTPTSGSAPVFFDYSRLWARFIGETRTMGYPRQLVTRAVHTERGRPASVKDLLAKDAPTGQAPTTDRVWHPPSGLPRSQQRLLDWGIVQGRTFLNFEAVPPFQGRIPGELVFITGNLKAGAKGAHVLSTLNEESNVSPFILMDDGKTVLLGTLGQLEASGVGRKRVHSTARPVLSTLQSLMDEVQVTIERVDGIRKVVDQRYDRLVL